jgi:hypothetical protein
MQAIYMKPLERAAVLEAFHASLFMGISITKVV